MSPEVFRLVVYGLGIILPLSYLAVFLLYMVEGDPLAPRLGLLCIAFAIFVFLLATLLIEWIFEGVTNVGRRNLFLTGGGTFLAIACWALVYEIRKLASEKKIKVNNKNKES